MTVTFVTCLFHIYNMNYDDKNINWRIERFKELLNTGIHICIYVCPVLEPMIRYLEEKYENLRIMKVVEIEELSVYNETVKYDFTLPEQRNLLKDTPNYMFVINSKSEFMNHVVQENPWNTSHFSWVDFNITHIFKDKVKSLRFLKDMEHHTWKPSCLLIPGCWDRHDNIHCERVHWRFCGGFLLGDAESIQRFHHLYTTEYPKFIQTHKKLVWEVNFWAWLEMNSDWTPDHYKADHDDSIIRAISPSNYTLNLTDLGTVQQIYDYPRIDGYNPGSASYIFYQGKHLLNTRHVNYWYYDNGSYMFYDDTNIIRTKNITSELDYDASGNLIPLNYDEMAETIKLPKYDMYSRGIEDIRLYEHDGILKYIATTVGYYSTGGNRMIIGDYNYETKNYSNSRIIEPPTDTRCEKNWIPVTDPEGLGRELFIYKWAPFEIGKIFREPDKKPQLKIVQSFNETYGVHEFQHMKGSTPFIGFGPDELVGVVHFSEDTKPRSYFHMMVILDKMTLKPIRYSEPFVFEKVGIEFCIGFRIHNGNYEFWISRMDREPVLIRISYDLLKINHLFLCE